MKVVPRPLKPVSDSGAQCNLMGESYKKKLGIEGKKMVPVELRMKAVNSEEIKITGAAFIRLRGQDVDTGIRVETAAMVYFTPSTNDFYLSRQTMRQLGIILSDFPAVHTPVGVQHSSSSVDYRAVAPCGCPAKVKSPGRPDKLLYTPIEANDGLMKEWLLERYAASTFNRCPHQTLPMMTGDPVRIHIRPGAAPVTAHKPASVPLHYKEEVN